VLADSDGLRNAIFGDREVLGGESLNRYPVFVFDDDGFDDELYFDGEGEVLGSVGRLVLAGLRSGESGHDQEDGKGWKYAHR
jgi:hypothetical protein